MVLFGQCAGCLLPFLCVATCMWLTALLACAVGASSASAPRICGHGVLSRLLMILLLVCLASIDFVLYQEISREVADMFALDIQGRQAGKLWAHCLPSRQHMLSKWVIEGQSSTQRERTVRAHANCCKNAGRVRHSSRDQGTSRALPPQVQRSPQNCRSCGSFIPDDIIKKRTK